MNPETVATPGGMVVSDLHLFARRSIRRELMRDLPPDLRRIPLLQIRRKL